MPDLDTGAPSLVTPIEAGPDRPTEKVYSPGERVLVWVEVLSTSDRGHHVARLGACVFAPSALELTLAEPQITELTAMLSPMGLGPTSALIMQTPNIPGEAPEAPESA